MSDQESDRKKQPPEVIPEPGWVPVRPPNLEGGRSSFVSGEPAEGRLRVCYFRRPQDDRMVGRAWFGAGAEGPPGHAHGGAMAAVLDEAMGSCGWMAGYPVVAAHIEADFRRMLPLGTDARLEAWVERVEGRKVFIRALLADEDGDLFASSSGTFVVLRPELLGKHLDSIAETLGIEPEVLRSRMQVAVPDA